MQEYWMIHYNENADRFKDSPLKQVDRTINGSEMGEEQIQLTVDSVIQALDLCNSDRIVDLCCGNGIITRALADKVQRAVGVDFSSKLIDVANAISSAHNIRYLVKDVSALEPSFYGTANKVYMRDSVSCLDQESLNLVLKTLSLTQSVRSIFIAGVPDAAKLDIYYDTEEKMRYHRERERSGRPHIGTWWSQEDMRELVDQAGLQASILEQDKRLASSFYRYDCLLEK